MHRIVVLDPDIIASQEVRRLVEPNGEVFLATSIKEAKEIMADREPIAIIVIRWSVGKPLLRFIQWLGQSGFPGDIVAATPSDSMNLILYAAGCTERVDKQSELPETLLAMLPSLVDKPGQPGVA